MNFEQNLTYCSGYPAYVIAPTDIVQAYGGVRKKEIPVDKLKKGNKVSWYGATKNLDPHPDEVQHEFTVFSVDTLCTEDLGRVTSIHTVHEGSACYLKKLRGRREQTSDTPTKRKSHQWDAAENLGQIYLSWDISGDEDLIQEIYICGYTTGISGRIHSVELYLSNGRLLKICGDVFHDYNSRIRVFPPPQQSSNDTVEPRVLVGIECLTCMEERRFYGGISMIKFGLVKASDIIKTTPQMQGAASPDMSLSSSQSPPESLVVAYKSDALSISDLQSTSYGAMAYSLDQFPMKNSESLLSMEYPTLTPKLTVLQTQPLPDGKHVLLLVTENQASDLLIIVWNCGQNKARQFLLVPGVKQSDDAKNSVIDYKKETVLFYYKQDIMIWKLRAGGMGELRSPVFQCKSKDLRFLHRGDWTFGIMLGIWHFFFDLTSTGECKWHLDTTFGSSNEAQLQNFEEIADTHMTWKRLQRFKNQKLFSSFKDIYQNSKCLYPSNNSIYTCLITKDVESNQTRYAHICVSGADEKIHTLHLCKSWWQATFSPDNTYIVLLCCAKRIIRIVNLKLLSDEYLELPMFVDVQQIHVTLKSIVVYCLEKVFLVSLESAGITHELDPFDLQNFECSVQTVPRIEEFSSLSEDENSNLELKHVIMWDSSVSGQNVYMWMLPNCIKTVKTPFFVRDIPFSSQREIRGGEVHSPILFLPKQQFATIEHTQNAYNITLWKMPADDAQQQQKQFQDHSKQFSKCTMSREIRENQICTCQVCILDDSNLKIQLLTKGVIQNKQILELPDGDNQEVQIFQAQTEVQGANIIMHLWVATRCTSDCDVNQQKHNEQNNNSFEHNHKEEKVSLVESYHSENFLGQFQTLENQMDSVHWYKIILSGWRIEKPTVQKMCVGQLPQYCNQSQQRYASAHGHNVCVSIINGIDSLLVYLFYEQKQLQLTFNDCEYSNFKISETVQQLSVKVSQNSMSDILDCTIVVYVGSVVQLWRIYIDRDSNEFKELSNYMITPGYAYGINMESSYIDVGKQFLDLGVIKQPYLVSLSNCCSYIILFSEIQAHDCDDELHHLAFQQYLHCLNFNLGQLEVSVKQDVSMDERPILNFQVQAKFGVDDWQIMISALQGYWKILRGSLGERAKQSPVIQADIQTLFAQYNMLYLLSSKFIGCYNQTGEYILYELTQNQNMEKRLQFDIGAQGQNFFVDQQGAYFSAKLSANKKLLQFILLGANKLAFLVLHPQHDSRNIGSLPTYFKINDNSENNKQIESMDANILEKSLIWLEKQQISFVQAITQETVEQQNLLLQVLNNCNASLLARILANLQDIYWLAILPLFSYQDGDQFSNLGNNVARDEGFHGETFKLLLEWFFTKEEDGFTERFIWNIAPKSVAKMIPLIWSRLVNSYPQLAFQVVCEAQLIPSMKQLNPYSFHRLAVVKGSTQICMSHSIAPIPTTLWKETLTDSIEVQTASACVILFQGACRNDIKGLVQPLLYSDQGYERTYDLPAVRSVIQYQSDKYGKFLLQPEALLFVALLLSFHCFALGVTFLEEFPSSWSKVNDCGTFFVVTVIYGIGNIVLLVCAIYYRYLSQGSRQLAKGSRIGGTWEFIKTAITLILSYAALALQFVYLILLQPWVALIQCGVLIFRYTFMEYIQISKKGLLVYYSNPWNYLDAFAILMFICICGFYIFEWHDEVVDEHWVLRRTFISLVVMEQMALTFKILGFLKGFKTFGPTIQMIFEVFKDSKYFIMLLGIIISTFAIIFVVLFGTESRHIDAITMHYNSNPDQLQAIKSIAEQPEKFEVDFKSAFQAFLAALALAIANVNLGEFTGSMFNFIAGPLFVIYILLVHIVLFNLLIAILSSVYEKIRADEQARFLGGQAAIMDDLLACSSFTHGPELTQYLHILHQNQDHLGGSVHDEWMGVTDWMKRQLLTMKSDFKRQMTHQHSRSQQILHSHSNNLESVLSQEVGTLRSDFQEQLQQYDDGISHKIKETIKQELHEFFAEFEKRAVFKIRGRSFSSQQD